MTLAVLVPVKDLSRAKTRLARLLSEAERAELAGLLLAGLAIVTFLLLFARH